MHTRCHRVYTFSKGRHGFLLFYTLLTIGTLCLRLVRLSVEPFGLTAEEVGMAYDAINLANYGVDRHLLSFPLYLLGFGAGQSTLYTYLLAIIAKVVPLTAFYIRLPAVLSGILCTIFGTLAVQRLYGKPAAVSGGILFALAPIQFSQSRAGSGMQLLCGFFALFFYFAVCLFEKAAKPGLISCLCALSAGLCVYAHPYGIWFMPIMVFITVLLAIHVHLPRKAWVATALCFLLLSFPYYYLAFREGIAFPSLSINNISTLVQSVFFGDAPGYLRMDSFYTLLIPTLPFAFYGIGRAFGRAARSFTQHEASGILLFPLLAALCLCYLFVQPNTNTLGPVYFLVIICTAGAFGYCFSHLQKRTMKLCAVVAFLLVYAFSSLAYLYTYFTTSLGRPQIGYATPYTVPLQILTQASFNGDIVFDGYDVTHPEMYYLMAMQAPAYEAENILHSNVTFGIQAETGKFPITDKTAYVVSEKNDVLIAQLIKTEAFHYEVYANYYVFIPIA